MRQGRGELAERGYACDVLQFCPLLRGGRLRLFASRDIHRNAEQLWAGAVVGPHTTTPPMNPAGRAIRVLHAILHFVVASRLERLSDRGSAVGAILGVHAIERCRKIELRVWPEAK